MSAWTADQHKDTDWELLARYLSDECSPEDGAIIEEWMNADAGNEQLIRSMMAVWNAPEPPSVQSDIEKLWTQVAEGARIPVTLNGGRSRKTSQDMLTRRSWFSGLHVNANRLLSYAAVLVAGSILAILATREYTGLWQGQAFAKLSTITVANGDRLRVQLADGTVVTLDAGTSLQYPRIFGGNTREVSLNGEAYFDVQADQEHPFIVHANHAMVEVLGTEFNIRAWQPYRRVTVSVVEGRVSLRPEAGTTQDAVIVDGGQSSTLPKDGLPSTPEPSDVDALIGWMNNKVIFRDVPLGEILHQLERWYDIEFVLEDPSVEEERLYIHIQDEPVDQVLNLIATLIDSDYEMRDNSVVLLKAKR